MITDSVMTGSISYYGHKKRAGQIPAYFSNAVHVSCATVPK